MATTLVAASALFAHIPQFIRRVAPWFGAAPAPARVQQARAVMPAPRAALTPPRRLRVVRVIEGARSSASAGRMVISGRMADVCAELERLAALEAGAG